MLEEFLDKTGLAHLWERVKSLINDTSLHTDRTFSSDYIDKNYIKIVNGSVTSHPIPVNLPALGGSGQTRLYHNPITNLWIAFKALGGDDNVMAYSTKILPTNASDWQYIRKTDVGLSSNSADIITQVDDRSYMLNKDQKFGYTTDGETWTIAPSDSNVLPANEARGWLIKFNNTYYCFNQRSNSSGYLSSSSYYTSNDGWNYTQSTFNINGTTKTYNGFCSPRVYNNKLYVCTANGILLEYDGNNWKEYDVVGKTITTPYVGDICSDFIIYKNKWIVFSNSSIWADGKPKGYSSVYISVDDGSTWTKYYITPQGSLDTNGQYDSTKDNGNNSQHHELIQFGGKLAVIMRNGNIYISTDGEEWTCYPSKYTDNENGILNDEGKDGYNNFFSWNGYLVVSATSGVYFINTTNFIGGDSFIPFNNEALISQDNKNHIVGLFNNLIMYNTVTKEYTFDGAFINALKNALNN